jgi:hypothetical protein
MPNRAVAVTLLLAFLVAGGVSAATFQLPENDAVAGWEREGRLRRFPAADLYGHINGGAELFLELGFVELLVQPYRQGEREIGLEVYRMESPLAALAIYLFKCGEETPWSEIEARNSSGRFQATLVRGDCFVLINSFSGESALRPAVAGLAGKLLESIPPADIPDPFQQLPARGRIAGSERLIRGEYSLESLYTLGPGDVLQLGGEVFGVAADYTATGDSGPETVIRVIYPTADRATQAFAHLQAVLDPALDPLEKSRELLVFRDFAGKFGTAKLEAPAIEVRVNLASPPGTSGPSTVVP